MGLSTRGLLLLGGVALLLAVGRSGSSSSPPHSLRYFYTALSEPSQGLPQFSIVGYVDDQPFTRYDSVRRRDVPLVPWMEEFGKEDPQYWERSTQISQSTEPVFRVNLGTLRERFNQQNSTGFHTLQVMYGCEVGPDGQLSRGNMQYSYNGEDFLALDRETLTWTARVPQGMVTKRRWEAEIHHALFYKSYLEETCVEWLRRYLGYGNETLLRTELPTARVARKKVVDGQETLLCQLYGFYPKEIEVTWMKDGEDRTAEILTGGVVPNSDGTYHTWVSIDVDPKERERYLCQVGHDSLLEPLSLAWEEPGSSSSCNRLHFYVSGTEPRPGQPEFSILGYLSNQVFEKYDSFTKRAVPQLPWMEDFGEEESQLSRMRESMLRADLKALWDRYNQENSTGLHTWQNMYNCEVGPDGRFRRGHWQFAHDGENFIALDIKTLTWTGHDAPQEPEARRRWEARTPEAQFLRSYLEEECVAWLQRYLDYGKETLQRTERPTVRVARKEGHGGRETLICHLYGFYPKWIYVTWMKDGEDRGLDTFKEDFLPNLDGTYYTWLSIEVDPKEWDLYQCHVEHHSLPEPLDLAWEEPEHL